MPDSSYHAYGHRVFVTTPDSPAETHPEKPEREVPTVSHRQFGDPHASFVPQRKHAMNRRVSRSVGRDYL